MNKLVVGIDGILLRQGDAGSQRLFEQLVHSISCFDSDYFFYIYTKKGVLSSEKRPILDSIKYIDVNIPNILPRALAHQLYWLLADKFNLCLLHSPVFVPPVFIKNKIVLTVLDLTYWLLPGSQKVTGRFWWSVFGEKGISRANRIITLSHATKNDLINILKITPEKIDVIYPYVSERFCPSKNYEIMAKYRLPEEYILYVGTLEPRKNISNLLKGYARLLQRYKAPPLVLVGKKGWLSENLERTIKELRLDKWIINTGYIPDDDLVAIYSGATLFIYLSLYEGFGYPVLEAMACGVPVITSMLSSLTEIAGDAAIKIDPYDIEGISYAIESLVRNKSLRKELVQKGLEHVKEFSVQKFATQLISTYQKTIETDS